MWSVHPMIILSSSNLFFYHQFYVCDNLNLVSCNQVRVLDVEREESVGDSDVLVMATDGLWDVVSNAAVAEVVKAGLKLYEDADETRRRYRHISIAQVSRVFYRVPVLGWHFLPVSFSNVGEQLPPRST